MKGSTSVDLDIPVNLLKVCPRDLEVNANINYLVWKLPANNKFLDLVSAPNAKFGVIHIKQESKKAFFEKLESKLDLYEASSEISDVKLVFKFLYDLQCLHAYYGSTDISFGCLHVYKFLCTTI